MSTAKATLTIDTSQLVDGPTETANASDVTTPLDDLLDISKLGSMSVSSNDTHIKPLNEALTVTGSGIAKAIQNASGDETLQLSLATKLEQLLALLATGGLVPASAIGSGGASNGDVLTANGSGGASFAASGGGGATPVDVTGTAGEDLALRDFVYLNESDGEWYKIDIDADPIACGSLRGCVNEASGITNNSTGSVRILGEVDGFTLTAWGRVWAHTTAGSYTQTKPNPTLGGSEVIVAPMGYAISTTAILIQPRPVQYMLADTVADDGTLTIAHHTDEKGRERELKVYLASESEGTSIASYASSNQDSDVLLRDQTPGGYTADQCSGGTASADTAGDGAAANAFDDNNGTRWGTNSGSTGWLEYDFGTTKTIRQYTVRARDGSVAQSPKDWTFQYYNGSWVTVDTVTGETAWGSNELRTFAVDTANVAQRWRINVSNNNGGGRVSIAEMEMMETLSAIDGNASLAQSFEVTGTQTVKTVDLWLKKTGSPTGTLTLRIETDNAGEPSGTLAHANLTTTLAESSLSASYGDMTFAFSTGASISGSTPYWLVLSTDRSASETNYVSWGADGSSPSYADGEMMSELSSSWSAESKDAVFEVFAEGIQYDSPALVDDWDTALAVFGARYDDGAGSNPNTNTTIKNYTGVSKDVIAVLELR